MGVAAVSEDDLEMSFSGCQKNGCVEMGGSLCKVTRLSATACQSQGVS